MFELKNKRLAAIAELIVPCDTAADIGTDHALLPIALVTEGKCNRVIACDVRSGPLLAAKKNIEENACSPQIETRLGFGLEVLSQGECECIVIAGMGGLLIRDILERSPGIAKQARQLILQPNTCIYELRQYLASSGYETVDEQGVFDADHEYLILSCRAVEDGAADGRKTAPLPESDEEKELYYWMGGIMSKRRSESDLRYLKYLRQKAVRVLSGMASAGKPLDAEKTEKKRQYEAVVRAIDAVLNGIDCEPGKSEGEV